MEKSFDPSHDSLHLHRVVENCRTISRSHPCNQRVLIAAALLHDIVNIPKNHPERSHASRLAAERAGQFLAENEFSEAEISHVQTVIREHSFSAGLKPSCPESAVLQDADRLDALGAVGVMRTVTCGTKMGSRYYSEREPIPVQRILDDRTHTIDHFYVKLFRLADLMNTEAGKKEAQLRVAFMKTFLAQLETEVTSGMSP